MTISSAKASQYAVPDNIQYYSPPPTEDFLFHTPLPPGNSSLVSYFASKVFACTETPPPPPPPSSQERPLTFHDGDWFKSLLDVLMADPTVNLCGIIVFSLHILHQWVILESFHIASCGLDNMSRLHLNLYVIMRQNFSRKKTKKKKQKKN